MVITELQVIVMCDVFVGVSERIQRHFFMGREYNRGNEFAH